MNEEELRAHLQGRPGHNMGTGSPYDLHRIRGYDALRVRHIQDHEEEGDFVGHSHEPGEGIDVSHTHSSDEAGGMLISELFDLPVRARIQRVFNDRSQRRG